MMKTYWQEINDLNLWDKSLESNPEVSFLQAFEFGQFQQNLGNDVFRFGIKEGEKLKSFCQVILLSTKLGKFFYVPGGPILSDWGEELTSLLTILKPLAMQKGASFIRFDPRILAEKTQALLWESKLKPASVFTQPAASLTLDLTKSTEELKSNLSDSTRYNIGWVARKGVRVEVSQNETDIVFFNKLLTETASRHSFRLYRDKTYYQKQYQAFEKTGKAKLFLAFEPEEFGQEILAAAIVIYFGGIATYLHAASSNKNPKLRAPYLMQWEIIEDAKSSGFKKYDFWGIAKNDDPKDPWAGVTEFKRSFGGSKVFYQKPYDLALDKRYYLAKGLEILRTTSRKILR